MRLSRAVLASSTARHPLKVLINGADVSGLTAGLALARRGVKPVVLNSGGVVEEERKQAVWLPPNAVAVLRHLGLEEEARSHGSDVPTYSVTGHTGKAYGTMEFSKLCSQLKMPLPLGISRAHLLRILRDALQQEGVTVRDGSRLLRMDKQKDGRYAAVLNRAEKVAADVVVGADGPGSKIREVAYKQSNATVAPCRYTTWHARLQRPQIPSIPSGLVEMWGGNRRLFIYPSGDNHIDVWGTLHAANPNNQAGVLVRPGYVMVDHFNTYFSGCGLHAIWDAIEEQEVSVVTQQPARVRVPNLTHSKLPFILIGDAGHALAPTILQGVALGMEDALLLGDSIGFLSSGEKRATPEDVHDALHQVGQKRAERARYMTKEAQKADVSSAADGRMRAALRHYLMMWGSSSMSLRLRMKRYATQYNEELMQRKEQLPKP